MKKITTRMLIEAGIMIALAQVLSYFKLYHAPFGGSVTAGSMIPIILFAIRWGVGPGMLAGVCYGLLQFILDPDHVFHIVSILFDYILAFGALGLAGIFRKNVFGIILGIFVGIFARFICHIISGVVVFASYAPEGMNPWIYSILYNGAYLLPELVISLIIVGLLYKPLHNSSILKTN